MKKEAKKYSEKSDHKPNLSKKEDIRIHACTKKKYLIPPNSATAHHKKSFL
jgi:hypothetical protein